MVLETRTTSRLPMVKTMAPSCADRARRGQTESRVAHTHEIARSTRASATNPFSNLIERDSWGYQPKPTVALTALGQ